MITWSPNLTRKFWGKETDILQVSSPQGKNTLSYYLIQAILKNKLVIVITNFMPVKLMVVESQWMILTALDKRGIYRVIPDKDSTQSIIIR